MLAPCSAEAGSELGSFNYDSPLGREALVQVMTNIKATPAQVPLAALQAQGLVPDGVADEAGVETSLDGGASAASVAEVLLENGRPLLVASGAVGATLLA